MASLDAFLGLDQTFLGTVTPKRWHSTFGTVLPKESFKETTRVFIYKVATLDKGNTFLQRFATLSFQKTLWDRCEEHDFIYICVKAGDELIIYDHSRLSIIAEIKSSKDESLTSHFATDISKEYSLLNLFYIVKD